MKVMPPQQAGLLYSGRHHVGDPIAMTGSTRTLPSAVDAHQFHVVDDKQEKDTTKNKTGTKMQKRGTPHETLMTLFPYLFQFQKTIVDSSPKGKEEEEAEVVEEEEVERHVRFAGEVVEQWEEDTTTNDAGRIRSSSTFVDAIEVVEIPHVSDYTKEDKCTLWYTRKEMRQLQRNCLHTMNHTLTHHQQTHNCSAVESLYCCSYLLRGLERFIDYPQIMNNFNNCKSNSSTTRNDHKYVRTTRTTNIRRYDSIIAVLNEQCKQRVECVQHHGKVKKGSYNPDRLRAVYEKKGNTTESLQEAHYLAMHDERHVKEEYDNSREELESSSSSSSSLDDDSSLSSSSSSYHYSPNDDDTVGNNDDDDHRYHFHHHHHHHHNTSNSCTIIDNNIIHNNLLMKSVLRKLITPFVKVPPLGNMVVGINHHTECS